MELQETMLVPEHPDVVWCSGPDTIRFLNDLISQEIADVPAGSVTRSFLLEPTGKVDHLLWVLRGDEEAALVTGEGLGSDVVDRLTRYRLRVDVEIELLKGPSWVLVGEQPPDPGRWSGGKDGLVADISWPGVARSLHVGEKPEVPEMSEAEYESLRVQAGEPLRDVDLDDRTIPHETGLVPVTVDFDKGCFLGQELVARMDSRGGNAPRRIRQILFEDGAPPPGSAVEAGAKQVGVVSSIGDQIGLGLLARAVEPGDEVVAGGKTGVVRSLPEGRFTGS